MEQLVARRAHNPKVISSSLVPATRKAAAMRLFLFQIIAMEEETVIYILYSSKHQKQYTGRSTQLIARFYSHNGLSKKGWTKNFRPWRVVHVEFYKTKPGAIAREKFLKSGQGRQWIKDNIRLD